MGWTGDIEGELARYAPELAGMVAVFEPAEHAAMRQRQSRLLANMPRYRSVFLISGPGIKFGSEPELEMLAIAGRLGSLRGLNFNPK